MAGLGGGFFGSGAKSSTQSTQTLTETTNVSGGVEEGWNISASGAVTLTDPNLIENAFRFASESLSLVERSAQKGQQSFEKALSQTLNIADSAKTQGSERLLYLGGAALAAFVLFAYLVKT